MQRQDMLNKISRGQGFIAALDQSGGSTPKALAGYGINEGAWSDEAEMFALIHAFRCRIMSSPAFTGSKLLGAILFESTMDGFIGGSPVPDALIARGIVPFVKVDKGLEPVSNGVQLMKPMPDLGNLLVRAKQFGVFGTKARSVIHLANRDGISAIVAQQFEIANQVLAMGLTPIIEPEISIHSVERAEAEGILVEELMTQLGTLGAGAQVMLKLSLPAQAGRFAALVNHPGVLRVVALSGGYGRTEACKKLSQNPGIIASFSRALLGDLRVHMEDSEFDVVLREAIDEIYNASLDLVA
mgnify:CR=1 FL=1